MIRKRLGSGIVSTKKLAGSFKDGAAYSLQRTVGSAFVRPLNFGPRNQGFNPTESHQSTGRHLLHAPRCSQDRATQARRVHASLFYVIRFRKHRLGRVYSWGFDLLHLEIQEWSMKFRC